VNERANSKICGATGFRLVAVFVVDVYVIRRRGFLPTKRDMRRGGDGVLTKRRQRRRGETEEYTRGIPNDFGSSGTAGFRCRGPKSRSTATRAKRSREKTATERARVARMAFFALHRLSSLAFYLGQTRIRLNALIKLLTWYGRPGGHRVSADPSWPFFARLVRSPFHFCPATSDCES